MIHADKKNKNHQDKTCSHKSNFPNNKQHFCSTDSMEFCFSPEFSSIALLLSGGDDLLYVKKTARKSAEV